MLDNLYTIDGNTSIDRDIFNPKELLAISNKIKKDSSKPQILIYHTHGSEKYIDSANRDSDRVIGVGKYLADILVDKYGYNVIHIKDKYDVIDNKWNRNAYDTAYPHIKKVLKRYPSIKVVIDLHRDSGREKVVTKIGDVNVAKIMLFNGVSRSKVGDRKEIVNHNLKYNLAFSLDMHMNAMEMYKDFTRRIYIKGYRYNMHLAKQYLLVEVGNDKNMVMEAKYAMIPFAKILNKVLTTN